MLQKNNIFPRFLSKKRLRTQGVKKKNSVFNFPERLSRSLEKVNILFRLTSFPNFRREWILPFKLNLMRRLPNAPIFADRFL